MFYCTFVFCLVAFVQEHSWVPLRNCAVCAESDVFVFAYIVCQWGQFYCIQCVFVFCVFLYCICIWQLSSTKPPLYLVSQTARFSQFKFRVQTIHILRTFLKIKLFWRKMKLTNDGHQKWKLEILNCQAEIVQIRFVLRRICNILTLIEILGQEGEGGQMGVWVTGFSEKLSWKSEDDGHGWYD